MADVEDDVLTQAAVELLQDGHETIGQHLDVTSSDDWGR